MIAFPQKLVRSFAALLGLVVTTPSLAQMAPTGDHYAARASDTGFDGGVSSSGGYGTSVPLNLPEARGGLPVSVRVVYGGRRFGAAGLGWDVPLSFIRRNVTVAHRRPADNPDANPQPREQLSLVLDGGGVDLVRNAEDTAWVARRDEAQLEVRDVGGGVLEMYDGYGRRYSFSSDGANADQTSVGALDNGNLYLLKDIFGPGGTPAAQPHVHLDYAFATPGLAQDLERGTQPTGLSIDLTSVRYNYDTATGTCAKHQVNLVYDTDSGPLLSLQMLGGTPLVRMHKLLAIDVTARDSAAESPHPCSDTTMRSLRTYNLEYQNDADTGQFQLHRVTLLGQENTDERAATLPVATYSYGQVTESNGSLRYRLSQVVPSASLPPGFDTSFAMASTAMVVGANPDVVTGSSLQNVLDMNGDGRPDLLYFRGEFHPSGPALTMHAALNKPDPADPSKSLFTPVDVGVNLREMQTQLNSRDVDSWGHSNDTDGSFNVVERWVQIIDMNGDGRLDIIRADEVGNAWVVYLNTPAVDDPDHIVWIRREIDIRPFLQHLPGHEQDPFLFIPVGINIPLSQTSSGHDHRYNHCWKWDGSQWTESLDGYSSSNPADKCQGPQGQDPRRNDFGWTNLAQKTITQWELRDINGDGYPDLVFLDGTGLGTQGAVLNLDAPNPPPQNPPGLGQQFRETQVTQPYELRGTTKVMAILNVAGVHLENDVEKQGVVEGTTYSFLVSGGTSAFSAPITLDVGCGVSRSQTDTDAAGRSATTEVCGFEDINSDGLPDRLGNAAVPDPVFGGSMLVNVARLGTGDASAPFSDAFIQLPGPASRSQSDLVPTDNPGGFRAAACPAQQNGPSPLPYPDSTFPIRQTHGFSDINGDGIRDYLARDANGVWTAALGTGVGFAAPKTIESEGSGFELSLERVGCFPDNTTSGTVAGLYDFYGEGQSTLVTNANNGLNIFRLNTSVVFGLGVVSNPPTSGLLTQVANGYGASTTITYRSAKEDTLTNHLLPRPELVVTAIATQDDRTKDQLSPVLYAYGEASQHFDAAYDRWVFPGYRRKVSLRNTGDANDPGAGNAVISDAIPFVPIVDFNDLEDFPTRLLRYLKAGRVSDVTKLSGELGRDPWALLTADIRTDARRIAATHMEYAGRLLPQGRSGNEFCVEMIFPYDYPNSHAYNNDFGSLDQCAERGFALQSSVTSWRGTPGTAVGTADVIVSPQIVKTGSSVNAFDDFGRVTDSTDNGDLADDNNVPNDNLCYHVDYAAPQTSPVRILNAVAQQTVQDCRGVTLASKRFEYDGFFGHAAGKVTNGFLNISRVTRYDMDTHASLGDLELFQVGFDPAGNPRNISRTRDEDGAGNFTDLTYDPFGLVTTKVTVSAVNPDRTDSPQLTTIFTRDPVTLNTTSTTDPNGTARGGAYDGFGRVTRSTVTPYGGTSGVSSATTYDGFTLIDTDGDGIPDSTPPQGRSIAQKIFQDTVPEVNVATAPGRIGTTFFDSLGRTLRTEAQLGADYQRTVVIGQRIYDPLGRVRFMSDPFATDERVAGYGTTYSYNIDGTPNCLVRGRGPLSITAGMVDEVQEIYSTCFNRVFADNRELQVRNDADSFLVDSPQFGVASRKTLDATGRVLEQDVVKDDSGMKVLADAAFGYDGLGHLTSATRYLDPVNKAGPATTTWHYDSLGWMTRLDEPGVASQTRTFNSWGQVTQVQWCDDNSAAPCPAQDRRSMSFFDGSGRLIHREDRIAGQIVSGSVHNYQYDGSHNPFIPDLLLGRLWVADGVRFSYDNLGRVKTKQFATGTGNSIVVETHDYHDDGSEKVLHLGLPDSFSDEQVTYAYDSAGRVNSVAYNDGASAQTLFSAAPNRALYDPFGRLTGAQYGPAQFSAEYATTGRRLLNNVSTTSRDGAHSRMLLFPTGIDELPAPFDPVGRERQRREFVDSNNSFVRMRSYDALGRLSATQNLQVVPDTVLPDRAFTYDALGNILTQTDANSGHTGSVSLSYGTTDPDRVCGLAYGTDTAPQAPNCNVTYDGAGNILTMPKRNGGTRSISYFPNGSVSSMADGASNATFSYDAFGSLQQLTINSTLADQRADKYFGAFVKQRIEGAQSVTNRRIPLPGGTATRHGPTNNWTFAFSEARGTRFVTDQNGNFVQDIDYQPFGEVRNPSGATPGTTNYENEQWNGGDRLAAFGVVNLGARLYDPVIGRFLSRDPIIQPRNAYAFADNDPINRIDPTGLMSAYPTGFSGNSEGIIPLPRPTHEDVHGQDSSDDTTGSGEDIGTGIVDPPTPSCDIGCALGPSGVIGSPNMAVPNPIRTGGARNLLASPNFGLPPATPSGSPHAVTPYDSSTFHCDAVIKTCFTEKPTVKDYVGHWYDGTGWPVNRRGEKVDLGSYSPYQFERPAGTRQVVSPSVRDAATSILPYWTGDLSQARTDAWLYGHINRSTILGNGLVQLADDTFTFKRDWDDRKSRDFQTFVQQHIVANGDYGKDFKTTFIGPTPVPTFHELEPELVPGLLLAP